MAFVYDEIVTPPDDGKIQTCVSRKAAVISAPCARFINPEKVQRHKT
jgi:hypothetical protein